MASLPRTILQVHDRGYYSLYAACVDLGVPFFTQVGHTGPLRPSKTGRPIPYVDQFALDFPELVIVAGHIGYPWIEEMIAVARKREHVYIDTSAYTARRYPRELVAYMQSRGGRQKVLFGSNYPMLTPSRRSRVLTNSGSTMRSVTSSSPATPTACSTESAGYT
jgi:predicted TIM-barrel fold metal-dependent hydrolase